MYCLQFRTFMYKFSIISSSNLCPEESSRLGGEEYSVHWNAIIPAVGSNEQIMFNQTEESDQCIGFSNDVFIYFHCLYIIIVILLYILLLYYT